MGCGADAHRRASSTYQVAEALWIWFVEAMSFPLVVAALPAATLEAMLQPVMPPRQRLPLSATPRSARSTRAPPRPVYPAAPQIRLAATRVTCSAKRAYLATQRGAGGARTLLFLPASSTPTNLCPEGTNHGAKSGRPARCRVPTYQPQSHGGQGGALAASSAHWLEVLVRRRQFGRRRAQENLNREDFNQ